MSQQQNIPDSSSRDSEKKNDVQTSVAVEVENIFEHVSRNSGDEALKALEVLGGETISMTPEMEKALLRKIDWNLMPILCVVYCLNYLDKVTLSYTSVMGLQKAIHLKGDNYQWLGSIFFIGYLVWEYPTSRLLQRLPLGKYSAFNIIMWGFTLCCLAAVKEFKGAVTVRFLLGAFEATVTPGFALFTSQWYTKSEQGTRTGIWFSFNGFAQILGGVIAYGISVGTKKHGAALPAWKIVFLACGLVTIAVGIVFLWLMPDNQMNARFLTSDEKRMAIERIRKNQQGIGNKHFRMYQLKEALLDPMSWAFFLYAILGSIPYGVGTFFSQLIVSFGFTPDQSLLLGTPAGAVTAVFVIATSWLGDKHQNRILFASSGVLTSILGTLLMVCLPSSNKVGRLVGFYLFNALPSGFVSVLSLVSTNIAGYTKKTTIAALMLIGYSVGNIIGPQVFRPKDAPDYRPAQIVILVCLVGCVVDLAFIYWHYNRLNRKGSEIRAGPGYRTVDNQEFLDLTDRENHEFVYVL
ncbi:MFS allantoate transporter-like protein [Halenospora varia]|nr:MFS allantoate transporter-like protein [Halenospora varia]